MKLIKLAIYVTRDLTLVAGRGSGNAGRGSGNAGRGSGNAGCQTREGGLVA